MMRSYPKILIAAVFVFVSMQCIAGIRFHRNVYEKGLKMAKKEGKLVFLDTYTKYCGPCKKMDKIFQKHDIGEFFNDNFVNLKIDMDTKVGKKIHVKYDVFFVPTMLVMNASGMVIYRADKLMNAEELMRMGNRVLGNPHSSLASTNVPTSTTSRPSSAPTVRPATTTRRSSSPAVNNDDYTTKISSVTGSTIRVRKDQANASTTSSATSTTRPPSSTPTARPSTRRTSSTRRPTPPAKAGEEKILYVMDGKNAMADPDILYQEAYFRMELMDGSHRAAAKEYLKTQDDWTTEKNMNFILDFLYKTDAMEFEYVIYNRRKFELKLGKERVNNAVKILVYQKLHHGFPRPTLEEAQALLSHVDPSSSRTQAHKYYLNRMYEEENFKEYERVAKKYLDDYNKKDHTVMYQLAAILAEKKQDYKSAVKLMKKAVDLRPVKVKYHHLLAIYLYENSAKSKAQKAINKAINLAKAQGEATDLLEETRDSFMK